MSSYCLCWRVEAAQLTAMAFTPQPGRGAQPAIDGYVYQVVATVLAWLNLAEGQRLELEAGEDFDLVERESASEGADAARTVQQVHKRSRTITLRSPKTVSAIANFCAHRKINSDAVLRFRFLTTAKPGREKAWRIPGIVTWESLRQIPQESRGNSRPPVLRPVGRE